jgi:molybdate transport system substrate-binding protein
MILALAVLLLGGGSGSGTLDVFAAASLKEAFSAIEKKYEAAHPGVDVRLNFAGSQTLAAQIDNGAPADVFASAAVKNLEDVAYDKSTYKVFAHNKLEIAVRNGQAGIATPRDLTKAMVLVVADPSVPVGAYTESFFTKAAKKYGSDWLKTVRSHIASREVDVKAVLAKVKLGEADGGIVYHSDLATAGKTVQSVVIPDDLNEFADYPAAVPKSATNKSEAKRFIDYLLGDDAQRELERAGFVRAKRG